MVGSQQKHDWLQRKLYSHPEILGVNSSDIVQRAMEYELLYKGHTLTIPDVYHRTQDKSYFTEIKSGNNQKLFSKGMSQLEKICLWADTQGIPNFQAQMIMPLNPEEKLWINMLHELDFYKPGDSYRGRYS